MLTNNDEHAAGIAEAAPEPGRGFLSLHRRFELIVAALAIGAVTIAALEAEPAAAQGAILIAGPALGSWRRRDSSRRGASFLQRKIRCSSVSDRLQDEG